MTPPPDNDPWSLTADQRQLLDICEQIRLLPEPIAEDLFVDLATEACDLIEERGKALHGEPRLTIDTLAKYRAGFDKDGHELAAEGIGRIIERYFLEAAAIAARDAPLN
jgi:hypothetical protein